MPIVFGAFRIIKLLSIGGVDTELNSALENHSEKPDRTFLFGNAHIATSAIVEIDPKINSGLIQLKIFSSPPAS